MANEKERMPATFVHTPEQLARRAATAAKNDARKIAAQKAKESHDRVMSDPRRIEALKRMQDFHFKGEQALINSTSKTRAVTPQVREAARKEYADYQSKLKDDYITNKTKRLKEQNRKNALLGIRDTKPGAFFRNREMERESPAMALNREIQEQEEYLAKKQNQPTGMKKGGAVKSASSRADGIAVRGKTRAGK